MKDFRENFWRLKKDYVYLDNAASTPPLKNVMDKMEGFMENYSSIHRGAGELSYISTEAYENARKLVLEYLNGDKEKDVVVFTANSTDGINRLALLYPFCTNGQVLVSDIEHSSNLLPWIKNARKVVTFETVNFKIDPQTIEKHLKNNPYIKLVAISGSSNLTGYIPPLHEIYDICKKYDVRLLVDASQLAPHFPVSLDYCDFIVFSGHKMYAPFGGGVLAGRKDMLNNTGLAPTGGGNVVYISKDNEVFYKPAPFRHEAGTPNAIGAITLAESMRTLNEEIGWKNILEHNEEILRYGIEQFSKLDNIDLYFSKEEFKNRSPIIVFGMKNGKNSEATDILRKANIGVRCGTFCLYRLFEKLKHIDFADYREEVVQTGQLPKAYELIRASCGLMNTKEDIDKIVEVLKSIK